MSEPQVIVVPSALGKRLALSSAAIGVLYGVGSELAFERFFHPFSNPGVSLLWDLFLGILTPVGPGTALAAMLAMVTPKRATAIWCATAFFLGMTISGDSIGLAGARRPDGTMSTGALVLGRIEYYAVATLLACAWSWLIVSLARRRNGGVVVQSGRLCGYCGYDCGRTGCPACPECGIAGPSEAPGRWSYRMAAALARNAWPIAAAAIVAATGSVLWELRTVPMH